MLTEKSRHALDLAAYLLVQAKLAGDIATWNEAVHDIKPVTGVTCHDATDRGLEVELDPRRHVV